MCEVFKNVGMDERAEEMTSCKIRIIEYGYRYNLEFVF